MRSDIVLKDLITPLDPGICANGDETLASILPSMDGIYQCKIIFDNKDSFLGILNSYHSFFKKSHPFTTKAKHAVIKPQIITEDTSLFEVASFMASEQVFTVPVFKGEKVIGVVSAASLLKKIAENKQLLDSLAKNISLPPAVFSGPKSTVREVYTLLKQADTLGVMIQDSNGKLLGFVDRYNLRAAFIFPVDKKRFGKNGNQPTDRAFDTEPFDGLGEAVEKYMKPGLVVEDASASIPDLIKKLLESGQQTLFVNDKNNKSLGSLSYADILKSYSKLKGEENTNIIYKKPSSSVSEVEFREGYISLERFAEKINKRFPLDRIELNVEEPKYPDGQTAIFNTTLILVPLKKRHYVAKSKAKKYSQGIKSAIKQIEKQLLRDKLNNQKSSRKSISEISMDLQPVNT